MNCDTKIVLVPWLTASHCLLEDVLNVWCIETESVPPVMTTSYNLSLQVSLHFTHGQRNLQVTLSRGILERFSQL